MKKILFGITNLTIGGAERVLVDIANELSKDYEVTIFSIYNGGELRKQLNTNIHTICMFNKKFEDFSKFGKIKNSLNLLFKAKLPHGYDTYVAFLEGPITRLFAKNRYYVSKDNYEVVDGKILVDKGVTGSDNTKLYTNKKGETKKKSKKTIKSNKENKIAWIHNDISKVFGDGFIAKIKLKKDKKAYKRFNKIVFVSEENRNDFNKYYGKFPNEEVIRNYLNYKRVLDRAEQKEDLPFSNKDINLLTCARLVEQKAIDRFINIHHKLENDGVHSKVYIVGDGPKRLELQKQIDSLGDTENFYLLGSKENPYPYIKHCDYFCLLSYYEGYAMAAEEAKILNKPIIATDTAIVENLAKYSKAQICKNTEEAIYNSLRNAILKSSEPEKSDNYEENDYKQYYDKILDNIKQIL